LSLQFFKSCAVIPFAVLLLACCPINASVADAKSTDNHPGTITVLFNPDQPANTFSPDRALGAGIDGHEKGEIDRIYQPANLRAMRSAGFKPLSYRLRTELGVEAWHWNPNGTWSDQQHTQGYWTSDSSAARPIQTCYGYFLPRRGSTTDQANNSGYSRLDDGDLATFWKSNPYLDQHYTGEDNALHPQWVLIDLGKEQPVNAIKIAWAMPYATNYFFEYGGGKLAGPEAAYLRGERAQMWRAFPAGAVHQANSGDALTRLSASPIAVRFVRITMTHSSGAPPPNSSDVRDGLGYAIRELYLGTVDDAGNFHDLIRHARDHDRQTVIHVSSTDPWHRAIDKDERTEQPGLDRVFSSGLTNGLPMLTAVPLLYDTPENTAALIRYLQSRQFSVEQIEMGEEPEGQYITPEDYAALYAQWADAIHKIASGLQLGGPCFAALDATPQPDLNQQSSRSWMKRFLDAMAIHGHTEDFKFFSFEWYPFDEACAASEPQLAAAPGMLATAIHEMGLSGLSRQIPWLMTEYGYSAFAAEAEVDLAGALLNAEIVGQFLTLGGSAAYLYGYEPNELISELPCTWGNNMLFLRDKNGRARSPLATYHAARLLTQVWAQSTDLPHRVYPAASDIQNELGQPLVTAYAVHRPDGLWALLLINKDPQRTWSVRAQFRNSKTQALTPLQGPAELFQYSSAQYVWRANRTHGHPVRNLPPGRKTFADGAGEFRLPPYSLSVVRGHGPDYI
jgi:hypothetical protein